jgi:hypothetical protein
VYRLNIDTASVHHQLVKIDVVFAFYLFYQLVRQCRASSKGKEAREN